MSNLIDIVKQILLKMKTQTIFLEWSKLISLDNDMSFFSIHISHKIVDK